jgi:hypothetical protein
MSRNHVQGNVARAGAFVNLAVNLAAVTLIALGYFTAVGQIAGIA